MAALAGYLFYGQVATYLVGAEMARLEEELGLAARAAARSPARSAAELLPVLRSHLPDHLANLALEVELARGRPAWLKESFQGLVRTADGHLLRAAAPHSGGLLVVSLPVMGELLSRWVAGIGTVRFLGGRPAPDESSPAGTGGRPRLRIGETVYDVDRGEQGGVLPPPEHRFDIAISGLLTAPAVNWETGPQAVPAALVVTTRPSLMNARLFSTLGELSRLPRTALAVVAVAFLVLEALSLWIGVRLTRSITRAVADLYEGTERIHSGGAEKQPSSENAEREHHRADMQPERHQHQHEEKADPRGGDIDHVRVP